MASIAVTGGNRWHPVVVAFAQVDDDDVDAVMAAASRWHLTKGYAQAQGRSGRVLLMHRVVLGLRPGDPDVDHANGDRLDNRRANLRTATLHENARNQRKVRGASRFKGVYWNRGRWQAGISLGGRTVHLGRFDTEEEAAAAYDVAARLHYGAFAATNVDIGAVP